MALAKHYGLSPTMVAAAIRDYATRATCTVCKVCLPLDRFACIPNANGRRLRDRTCMACREAKPLRMAHEEYAKPKPTPAPAKTMPYAGERAKTAYEIQSSLDHTEREDHRLIARTETGYLPGPVMRPGVTVSAAIAGYMRLAGGR